MNSSSSAHVMTPGGFHPSRVPSVRRAQRARLFTSILLLTAARLTSSKPSGHGAAELSKPLPRLPGVEPPQLYHTLQCRAARGRHDTSREAGQWSAAPTRALRHAPPTLLRAK